MMKTDWLSRYSHKGPSGGVLASLVAVSLVCGLSVSRMVQAEEVVQSPPEVAVATPPAAVGAQVEEDFKAGRTAYENNDWFAAMPVLRRSALAGHLPSMVMLGTILNRAAEPAEALYWYQKAAKAGSLDGAFWLGTLLAIELDAPAVTNDKVAPPRDETVIHGPEEALKWLTVAAQGNHPEAMFALSNVFSQGKLGQQVDPKVALDWLQRSADKGFTPAMKELAVVYARGFLGVPVNPIEADRLLKAVDAMEKTNSKVAPKGNKTTQRTTSK